jgi:hypothetical protein
MYIEFANVASPGDHVTAPSFGRGDALPYYNGLGSSPDLDYIRAPLTAATVEASDPTLFPNGNIAHYFAMTAATVGVHGKLFGSTHNSTVYGAALVATPVPGDPTQDLVFSRIYFDAPDQFLVAPNGQVGLGWEIEHD